MEEVARSKGFSPQFVSFLAGHGVPRGIAMQRRIPAEYCAELLTRIEMDPQAKIGKPVPRKKQAEWFRRCLQNPLERPYTLCISGEVSDKLPVASALLIFEEAMRQQNAQAAPYWHQLDGSPKDAVRDGDPMSKPPSLLVISNLATNSTMMKAEKLRDLLAIHSHIPRIVVTSGGNPASLFTTILFKPVDRLMFFGFQQEE